VLELVDWVEEAGFLTPVPEAPEPEPRREAARAADAVNGGAKRDRCGGVRRDHLASVSLSP